MSITLLNVLTYLIKIPAFAGELSYKLLSIFPEMFRNLILLFLVVFLTVIIISFFVKNTYDNLNIVFRISVFVFYALVVYFMWKYYLIDIKILSINDFFINGFKYAINHLLISILFTIFSIYLVFSSLYESSNSSNDYYESSSYTTAESRAINHADHIKRLVRELRR